MRASHDSHIMLTVPVSGATRAGRCLTQDAPGDGELRAMRAERRSSFGKRAQKCYNWKPARTTVTRRLTIAARRPYNTTAYRYPRERLILALTLLLVFLVIGLTATATICLSAVFVLAMLALSYALNRAPSFR